LTQHHLSPEPLTLMFNCFFPEKGHRYLSSNH
jgi:hypothetical protein